MEKFFIVHNEKLIKEYKDYVEDYNALNDVMKMIMNEFGIEAKQFYSYCDRLMIVLTENDKVKFSKSLLKNGERFRVNSKENKRFLELVKEYNIKGLRKPSYFNYINGRNSKYRMFGINNTIYGSYEMPYDFTLPSNFEEIKASEFYKIVEDNK